MRGRLLAALAAFASLGSGCQATGSFTCQEDAQCTRGALAGSCLDHGCAFPDDTCDSGLRFDETAPADANECTASAAPPAGCASWNAMLFDPCELPAPAGDLVLADTGRVYDTTADAFIPAAPMPYASALVTLATGEQVRVLSVNHFALAAGVPLRVTGDYPLVIAAWTELDLDGALDGSSSSSGVPGPGANPMACASGAPTPGGLGMHATNGGSNDRGGSGGGGGGAFAGGGGSGGAAETSAGTVDGGAGGVAQASIGFAGGCAGAASGAAGTASPPSTATTVAIGGSGGGAIALVAQTSMRVTGSINTGGSGGGGAPLGSACGGGGGGAGGSIYLGASAITVTGSLAANGGGGGGSAQASAAGLAGANGGLGTGTASGASSQGCAGGSGGAGAAGQNLAGSGGTIGLTCGGGGGGGGAGALMLVGGTVATDGATLSPDAPDSGGMQ
ncbi:MAG TPA: hypothetical protein VGM88_15755 [Kofleriaceae bacterium]